MSPASRAVAVFCGSRFGENPAHRQLAAALGAGIARLGLRLIYGGGHVGLMGVVADAALAAGGEVTGVIPEFLANREVAHHGVSDLRLTDSMHSRKRMMFSEADAFVTMPGGLGTLDETIEVTTWRQLGLHDKPIYICNVHGWADPLLHTLHAAVSAGFAGKDSLRLFEILPDVDAVLQTLADLPASGTGAASRT